jgi:threonine synthase
MRYRSTRSEAPDARLGEALAQGLAPDGGLYVPAEWPAADSWPPTPGESTAAIASRLLRPFFDGDPLESELDAICEEAFDFPAPLRPLANETAVLELFHGPTAAFKDFGARFLAATLARMKGDDPRPLTVLVATSGDTGGAVAAAFAGRPGFEVIVLYPRGMVSERQERQLTCWGGNVRAFRVRGDFDACQRLVKEAFQDAELREGRRLTSANSINLGRLLPQMVYYAEASLRYRASTGESPGFIIPSGNLGNATACLWAQRMGLPVRDVVLATNANETVTAFLSGEEWRPRPTVATLASAMDVGSPSNMERLIDFFGGPDRARRMLKAVLVTDETIRDEIARGEERWGEVWDPHTATAAAVRETLETPHWVLVATAHPAKFEGIVEPLVGHAVPIPPALEALLERQSRFTEIDPSLDELREALSSSAA